MSIMGRNQQTPSPQCATEAAWKSPRDSALHRFDREAPRPTSACVPRIGARRPTRFRPFAGHSRWLDGAHLVRVLGVLAAVAFSSMGPANSAQADEKRYPGSMCRVWSGPGAYLNFSSLVANGLPQKAEPNQVGGTCPPPQGGGCPSCDSTPACRNNPQYIVRVDCPIPKSFPDAGMSNVTVDVIDRHAVLDVECYLTSALWDAGINSFKQNSTKLKSAGKSNAIQPLIYAPQAPAGAASHWYIACSLPPDSAVVSYYVKEK